jgi:hypothetical protein
MLGNVCYRRVLTFCFISLTETLDLSTNSLNELPTVFNSTSLRKWAVASVTTVVTISELAPDLTLSSTLLLQLHSI